MHICYIDESGTSDIPGNTSHFILAGLSIPVSVWKNCDKDIELIKAKYNLQNSEIHTGWILRPYIEQNAILNFEKLGILQRKIQVSQLRKSELLSLQKKNAPNSHKQYKQTKKNYKNTEAYIHLT